MYTKWDIKTITLKSYQICDPKLPAVSHNPKLTMFPSTATLALKLSKTVGI